MQKSYWQENLRIVAILLAIWFVVSFPVSILFVDQLDNFRIFGFPLGFFMAQQGSIYIFVILILVYIRLMDRLDARFHVSEQELDEQSRQSSGESAE